MITVRRSSQYVAGKGIFTKETKTETSDRTIKLPAQAFEILREYKVWQLEERLKMGDRWEDNDRIFTQYDGKPVHPDSITGWFREYIAKTDLPQITIHSLRHTNITLLIAAGVPLRTVLECPPILVPVTMLEKGEKLTLNLDLKSRADQYWFVSVVFFSLLLHLNRLFTKYKQLTLVF